MKNKKVLEDIFNDEIFNQLNTEKKVSNFKSEDERLIDSFIEINEFYRKNNREPQSTSINEFKLFSRLKALRVDAKKAEILKEYDTYNLLSAKEIKTVSDIFEDDFGILDTDEALSIFELKNIPKNAERSETDYVARRKPMKDSEFALYEAKFKQVHKELREGKRKLGHFNNVETNLEEGRFYILDGVLLFLEKDGVSDRIIGDRTRKDGRTKIIFENSTISNMYYRSLAKALYNNGRIVTDTDKNIENELKANTQLIKEEDNETGWIYVLKAKSNNEDIKHIKNLYKIGFSRVPVAERIKNAKNEATYLKTDVEIVVTYKTFNLNVQKFENLLHRFFSEVCLNVDIYDESGRRITPREWFIVPLPIIDKVINLILSGEIVNYKYDAINEGLLEK